jgi:hypothetical protein
MIRNRGCGGLLLLLVVSRASMVRAAVAVSNAVAMFNRVRDSLRVV